MITGGPNKGLCGHNDLYMSRLPSQQTGKAAWTTVLATISTFPSQEEMAVNYKNEGRNSAIHIKVIEDPNEQLSLTPLQCDVLQSWDHLPTMPLISYAGTACILITRMSFITLMILTNTEQDYVYSDAAGHRAGYGSYCGQWNIEWPLGGRARVRLASHNIHTENVDVYPRKIHVRVNKCVEMYAGIITGDDNGRKFKIAFPGRAKQAGNWILEEQKKASGGSNGSRHLYNMMGGKVYEVDVLSRNRLTGFELADRKNALQLCIPSLALSGEPASLWIPSHEEYIIRAALDNLPWSLLSWSIHRGLKDILLAFGRPVMADYRTSLANTLRRAIEEHPHALLDKGWERSFVRNSMPDMAASSIMSGGGNSGDAIRVVPDAALLLCGERAHSKLNTTTFWRSTSAIRKEISIENVQNILNVDTIVALTKFFVLEWSVELDYQLHRHLPPEMVIG